MNLLGDANRSLLAEETIFEPVEYAGLRTNSQPTRTDLIVLATVFVGAISVLLVLLASAYRERVAEASLEHFGAEFFRQGPLPDELDNSPLRPVYRHFNVATRVFIRDWAGTESELESLSVLRELDSVEFYGESITDDALVHVQCLPNLIWLGLENTRVTDAGLEEVASLRRLRILYLNDSSSITGAGLNHLHVCPQLVSLQVARTRITDRDLQHFDRLSALKRLSLDGTKISDAGLAHLVTCPRLEILSLKKTLVTDQGIVLLARLPRLQSVDLFETAVTDEGANELKRLAPHLSIYWRLPDDTSKTLAPTIAE